MPCSGNGGRIPEQAPRNTPLENVPLMDEWLLTGKHSPILYDGGATDEPGSAQNVVLHSVLCKGQEEWSQCKRPKNSEKDLLQM